jgi:phosphatidate cytidylyltransferase
MKKRILTATVLCCVLLPVLFFGSYLMIALTMFLSFMGVYELINMYNKKHSLSNGYKYSLPILTSVITGLISFGFYYDTNIILYIALPLFVLMVVTLLVIAMFDKKINMSDMFIMFGFMLYGGLSFSLLAGLRFVQHTNCYDSWKLSLPFMDVNMLGLALVGYALVTSFATDIGAQLGGMAFGKHKLCPNISPKKTIEGALSGLLVGATAGTILLTICQYIGKFNVFGITKWYLNIPFIFVISLILSVFGQVGDLVASKIKREHDIKDYGNIFPGHGGVLDRFDSVIFVSLVAISIILIINFFIGGTLW